MSKRRGMTLRRLKAKRIFNPASHAMTEKKFVALTYSSPFGNVTTGGSF